MSSLLTLRTLAAPAVVALVWLAAGCSSDSPSKTDASSPAKGQPSSAAAQLQAFDPPSKFDPTRRVFLTHLGGITEGSHVQAALSGTTYLAVDAGDLIAADVSTGTKRWSVALVDNYTPATTTARSGPAAPVVVDDIVYGAVVGFREAQGSSLDSLEVNVAAVDINTGKTAWETSLPFAPTGTVSEASAPLVTTTITPTDQGIVVQVLPGVTAGTAEIAWLLDTPTGDTMWQVEGTVGASATGQYGVLISGWDINVLDMKTGQPGSGGPVERARDGFIAAPRSLPYDVDGWIAVGMDYMTPADEAEESPHVEMLNTANGTWENADHLNIDDDIAGPDSSCVLERGQTLLLCTTNKGTQGADYATGEVVWTADGTTRKKMTDAVQFHGNVYGTIGEESIVIDLATGNDLEVEPGLVPILVNEYGAVITDDQNEIFWVPATA